MLDPGRQRRCCEAEPRFCCESREGVVELVAFDRLDVSWA